MTTKVYLLPTDRLSLKDFNIMLKKAKQDARANKAASTVEGEKQNASKTA